MKFRLYLIMAILCLFMAGCGSKQVISENITFILDVYSGTVNTSTDDGKSWKKAEVGQELKEKDQIKTGPDSFCDIIMPKRGIFRVADNTLVLLSQLKKQLEQIDVQKGKILANITKKLAEEETFQVGTTTAVVSVRGTEFSVDTDGEKTVTTVKKGEVKVRKNISLNVTNLEPAELDSMIEIPVKQNENLEVNSAENKALEESVNGKLEGVIDIEKIKAVVKEASEKGKKEVRKVRDTETLNKEFSDIVKPERLKKIDEEGEKYRQEIDRDKKDLEQNVGDIKKKAGLKDIAGKKVGDEPTSAEQDIRSGEADKKANEAREKLAAKKKSSADNATVTDDRKKKLKNLMERSKKRLKSN